MDSKVVQAPRIEQESETVLRGLFNSKEQALGFDPEKVRMEKVVRYPERADSVNGVEYALLTCWGKEVHRLEDGSYYGTKILDSGHRLEVHFVNGRYSPDSYNPDQPRYLYEMQRIVLSHPTGGQFWDIVRESHPNVPIAFRADEVGDNGMTAHFRADLGVVIFRLDTLDAVSYLLHEEAHGWSWWGMAESEQVRETNASYLKQMSEKRTVMRWRSELEKVEARCGMTLAEALEIIHRQERMAALRTAMVFGAAKGPMRISDTWARKVALDNERWLESYDSYLFPGTWASQAGRTISGEVREAFKLNYDLKGDLEKKLHYMMLVEGVVPGKGRVAVRVGDRDVEISKNDFSVQFDIVEGGADGGEVRRKVKVYDHGVVVSQSGDGEPAVEVSRIDFTQLRKIEGQLQNGGYAELASIHEELIEIMDVAMHKVSLR